MDEDFWDLVHVIIPSITMNQAMNSVKGREKLIKTLLDTRRLPDVGWDDDTIKLLLQRLSCMDSNNIINVCGMGEREGRIYSDIIARRHYRFSHGVVKSDPLSNAQPIAIGSSLMYELTIFMIQDLFKIMDVKLRVDCALLPLNSGMSLMLCLLSLKATRPNAKYVIWSRYDQENHLSSIMNVGCVPIIIDQRLKGDSMETNTELIEDKLKSAHEEGILCIISATSCLAPRSCDNIEQIAKLSKFYKIPHIIMNASGLHSKYIMGRIQRAQKIGRIDLMLQSTDKNLLVPVGSTIIASFDKATIVDVLKTFPGTLAVSSITDVFVTLLSMGREGYKKLVEDRYEMHNMLVNKLTDRAIIYGEYLFKVPTNPSSVAISLQSFIGRDLVQLAMNIYMKNITGVKVTNINQTKKIGSIHFKDWGCHGPGIKVPFMSFVIGLGATVKDLASFTQKLEKVFGKNRDSEFSKTDVGVNK